VNIAGFPFVSKANSSRISGMDRDGIILAAIMIGALLLGGIGLYFAIQSRDEFSTACEAKGGVSVRLTCFRREVVIEVE
jgi:hypothetical protein